MIENDPLKLRKSLKKLHLKEEEVSQLADSGRYIALINEKPPIVETKSPRKEKDKANDADTVCFNLFQSEDEKESLSQNSPFSKCKAGFPLTDKKVFTGMDNSALVGDCRK